MDDTFKYTDKYVCYIDILGFTSAILHSDHPHFNRSVSYFKNALSLLNNIPSQKDLFLQDLQVSSFSDCVAFSCKITPPGLILFMRRIAYLQRELLNGGFSSRGALTKGEIYHEADCIFGSALIQAIELEKIAQVPRVILSTDIIEDIHNNNEFSYEGMYKQDTDKRYFVKYYWSQPMHSNYSEFYQLRETILLGLRQPILEEKYKWLAAQFNERLINKPIPNIMPIVL